MCRPQVQVNKQAVALPYKKFGLQVYESGINYVVDIPELGAVISYNGLSFSIRLPYYRFGNNTKGQCGEPRAAGPGSLWAVPWGGWWAETARAPACPGGAPPPLLWPLQGADQSLVSSVPSAPASWSAGRLGWRGRGAEGSWGSPRRPDGQARRVQCGPSRPHRHLQQRHPGRLCAAQWRGHLQLRGRS